MAFVPVASRKEALGCPASVVTDAPGAVIAQILLFPLSAT